jgi:hypothetical protein
MVENGLRWELQWHRAGAGSVRVGLSESMARGLATALVAAVAVAVGCSLANGLERIGARDALAAVSAENRALSLRREALRQRLTELDRRFEADGARGRAGEVDGGAGVVPNAPPTGGGSRPGND